MWKFFEAGQARGFRAIKKMTLLDRVSNKQLWKRLRVEGAVERQKKRSQDWNPQWQ